MSDDSLVSATARGCIIQSVVSHSLKSCQWPLNTFPLLFFVNAWGNILSLEHVVPSFMVNMCPTLTAWVLNGIPCLGMPHFSCYSCSAVFSDVVSFRLTETSFLFSVSESGKLMTWGSTDDLGQSYLTSGKHEVLISLFDSVRWFLPLCSVNQCHHAHRKFQRPFLFRLILQ